MNWANIRIRWKFQIAICAMLLPLYAVGFSVYYAVWEQVIAWYDLIPSIGIMVFVPIASNDGRLVATWAKRVQMIVVGLLAMMIVLLACFLLDRFNYSGDIRWWGLLAWSGVAGIGAATIVFLVAHLLCPWNLYGADAV